MFSKMFSKGHFLRVVKSRDCMVKSFKTLQEKEKMLELTSLLSLTLMVFFSGISFHLSHIELFPTQSRLLTTLHLRKHCGKKEKMLVTSIFSFFLDVFYLSPLPPPPKKKERKQKLFLQSHFFVVCTCFEFRPV